MKISFIIMQYFNITTFVDIIFYILDESGIFLDKKDGEPLSIGKYPNVEKKNDDNKETSNSDQYRQREDSVISGWSLDNVPEIRISQSESLENILRDDSENCSQSKSSSKETIVNIGNDNANLSLADDGPDDVFVEKKVQQSENKLNENRIDKLGQGGSENDECLEFGDSYESKPKSIRELSELAEKKSVDNDSKEENRKALAKIMVEGLPKK